MTTWQDVFKYLEERYAEAKRLDDEDFCIRLTRALAVMKADPHSNEVLHEKLIEKLAEEEHKQLEEET